MSDRSMSDAANARERMETARAEIADIVADIESQGVRVREVIINRRRTGAPVALIKMAGNNDE